MNYRQVVSVMACMWAAAFLFAIAPLADALEAQKIAEIKAGGNESLWEFLARLPGSFEAQIFYAVGIFGAVGMFMNYIQRWLKKEIAGNLWHYLFDCNIRGTLLSFSTTIGVGIGAITGGVFETASGEFVGWFNVMWVSLTNGFMWDVALNKSERAVWTEEQRSAKKGEGDGA